MELHPVEIIYNTPSILLFCRYANALRTLPDPLGRQHLNVQEGGLSSSSSTIRSRALLDVGWAGSAWSSSFLSTGSPGAVRKEHRMHRLQHIDHTRRISTSSKSPGCYGGFENRAEFSTAHPAFFLAITCPCCYCCFQPPSFNPCRISCYFFSRKHEITHFKRTN